MRPGHPHVRAKVQRAPHVVPPQRDHAKVTVYSFRSLHHFERGDKFRHTITLGRTQASDHRQLHGVRNVSAVPGEQHVHAVKCRTGNVQRIQLGLFGQPTAPKQVLGQLNDGGVNGQQWNWPQAVNARLRGNGIPSTGFLNNVGGNENIHLGQPSIPPCLGDLLTSRLQLVVAGLGRQIADNRSLNIDARSHENTLTDSGSRCEIGCAQVLRIGISRHCCSNPAISVWVNR